MSASANRYEGVLYMEDHFTNMRELVNGFANAMNLISPETQNHHQQVAYLAYHIANEMNYDDASRVKIIYSALLHDVGAVILPKAQSLLELERHSATLARAGAKLLGEVPKMAYIAEILLTSQTPFGKIPNMPIMPRPVMFGQIINLADMVSLLLDAGKPVLNQTDHVRKCVQNASGKAFHPKVVEAFLRVADHEYIWMNLLYHPNAYLEYIPKDRNVSLDETIELTRLVSRIIDYRSPFTAMHSAGVAASAAELAGLIGMSDEECKLMQIAGHLHDAGKLKIPTEILEKPGKLTDEEFNIIKDHVFYTYLLLKDIDGFGQITEWAAYHHEKLNGRGYPFHLKEEEIPLGSRIMAVADIFSAITEVRPYREGMEKEAAIKVMRENVRQGALSGHLVELLVSNYDKIDAAREREAREEGRRYYESLESRDNEAV